MFLYYIIECGLSLLLTFHLPPSSQWRKVTYNIKASEIHLVDHHTSRSPSASLQHFALHPRIAPNSSCPPPAAHTPAPAPANAHPVGRGAALAASRAVPTVPRAASAKGHLTSGAATPNVRKSLLSQVNRATCTNLQGFFHTTLNWSLHSFFYELFEWQSIHLDSSGKKIGG